VEGTDKLSGTIDIGLTKVSTAVRALCIEDMECIANPKLLPIASPQQPFF
jgi:hypothetical protein